MEDYLPEGDWEQVEISCPNCGSSNVVISLDNYGYYRVVECHRCGFKFYAREMTH